MRDLIFIYPNFFEDRDFERFGIELMRQNGIRVSVWSVIYLLSLGNQIKPIQNMTKQIDVYYPMNICDIKRRINQESEKEFLLLLNYYDLIEVRRELYRHNVRYYELKICPVLWYPEEFLRQNFFGRIKLQIGLEKKSKREILQSYIQGFLNPDSEKNLFNIDTIFHPPQAVFCSTQGDVCKESFATKHSKHYFLHTLDYDLYLGLKGQSLKYKRNYIVFVDDGESVYHPDDVLFRNRVLAQNDYERRRTRIINFLEQVEHTLDGMEVIVAGHPRVCYKGDEFGGREIVQFDTARLVKESKAVIISRSTAWNFVMLYNKPVLFYKILERRSLNDFIVMEKYLERKAFRIENVRNSRFLFQSIKKVKKSVREKYIREYIKGKDDEQKPFFEIVSNILKNDFAKNNLSEN